ncbi:hypothetical protein L2E82_33867 [Cichorium intybus]|uniref:Uncharacterized protein n=1 Tax=Cichorium intybus TaxID=13427 RepID=A0ACB9BLC7_CICIN|nr:hypothetical protein L2E82_33867 [Cichorium intybus]
MVNETTSYRLTMVREQNVLVYPQFGLFRLPILLKNHKRRLFATLLHFLSLWIFTFSSKIFPSLLFSCLSILFISALNSDCRDLFVSVVRSI